MTFLLLSGDQETHPSFCWAQLRKQNPLPVADGGSLCQIRGRGAAHSGANSLSTLQQPVGLEPVGQPAHQVL